jgi:hypothetical protein
MPNAIDVVLNRVSPRRIAQLPASAASVCSRW